MRRINCHASNKQGEEINAYISTRQDRDLRIRDNEISDSEEESDSEDDLVIAHYSSAESSESETNEEELVPVRRTVISSNSFWAQYWDIIFSIP